MYNSVKKSRKSDRQGGEAKVTDKEVKVMVANNYVVVIINFLSLY